MRHTNRLRIEKIAAWNLELDSFGICNSNANQASHFVRTAKCVQRESRMFLFSTSKLIPTDSGSARAILCNFFNFVLANACDCSVDRLMRKKWVHSILICWIVDAISRILCHSIGSTFCGNCDNDNEAKHNYRLWCRHGATGSLARNE